MLCLLILLLASCFLLLASCFLLLASFFLFLLLPTHDDFFFFFFTHFSLPSIFSTKPLTPCSTQSTLPSIGEDTLLLILLALFNLTFVCCNKLVYGDVFAVVFCSPRQQGCASQAIQGDKLRPVCLLLQLFVQSLHPRHIILRDRATMPSVAFEDVIQRKCGLVLRVCI